MRTGRVALVLGLVLVALIAAGLSYGPASLPLSEILRALMHDSSLPEWKAAIVTEVRLPRSLLAALLGGGLAVAGVAMQGIFRNPMADPGLIGVSGGAAFGAVCALYVGPVALSVWLVPASSFAGALGCAALVYQLASRRGKIAIDSLLLAGVAVGAMAAALTTLVLSLSLSNWEIGRQMTSWLMGGLEGRSMWHVALAAPLVLGGSLAMGAFARDLNVLSTGEESALALGVDVRRTRRRVLVLAALVTAGTVAVMGVVSFVGLIVPHVARLLLGPDHRRLLPVSFLLGSVTLLASDLLCRLAAPEHDLRLGVVTSLIGGPFFLYLLVRHKNEEHT